MNKATSVREGELLWTPSPSFAAQSRMNLFVQWLATERNRTLPDYDALWRWSVSDLEGFWAAVWDYFGVLSTTPYRKVVDRHTMPGARWFEGSLVNYSEHLLRHENSAGSGEIAIRSISELRSLADMNWQTLGSAVRKLATRMRALGIEPGDRVVSYLPNIPEAAIALMATTAIGAVWASAAPEFGVHTVIDRFAQIAPKLLFAADGYGFAGRNFERRREVDQIVEGLPSLSFVVWLGYLDADAVPPRVAHVVTWREALAGLEVSRAEFLYTRVPFDHPLWIVFSSGTTGLPKAIVHTHTGILVEHLKLAALHLNLGVGKVMFFHTTTGWMMWNLVIASLLVGATAVLYDGSPVYPDAGALWALAERAGVTHMGASPAFVQLTERAGIEPGERYDLRRLEMITVSGSPCMPETFAWIYRHVKSDVWVASQSGGTELCSGFVGASPTLAVYAGEIQARMLGMDVESWNDLGEPRINEVGELVVRQAFPSMPLYFWNDPAGKRYQESYFEGFPGVWRHGDFLKINSRGGCYVYGRSDSTLNRDGVRMGTAEIYRVVEQIESVRDSVIVCCERSDGSFFMPLFVCLKPGVTLDETLRKEINARLRKDCSPRHVPDRIEQIAMVPYTLTHKKMEIPIRKILMGVPEERAANRDAMSNPEALQYFVDYAQGRQA
jgi:acetoacetyl-CoA synthetase